MIQLTAHPAWLVCGLVVIALLATVASWLCTRWLIGYLQSRSVMAIENERSLHQGSIPRGGGLSIMILLLIALLFMSVLSERTVLFFGLFICVLLWVALGWSDDRLGLSAKRRLIVQFVFSVLMVMAFGWVGDVGNVSLGWFGPILTVIGVVWMANLYNFMDGMDGMAASQAIVAGLTFAVWFGFLGDIELSAICLALAGASYGFLWWNWQPARIFMGDVGSISLGAFFATLVIIANNRHQIPLMSSLLVFSVFIADASVTLLRRAYHREKVWQAHRSHYYQRLALLGYSHGKVVLGALTLMVVGAILGTLSLVVHGKLWLCLMIMALLLLFAFALVPWLEQRSKH